MPGQSKSPAVGEANEEGSATHLDDLRLFCNPNSPGKGMAYISTRDILWCIQGIGKLLNLIFFYL